MFTKALNYLNYGGITLTDNYGNSCNIPLFAITSTLYLYRRRAIREHFAAIALGLMPTRFKMSPNGQPPPSSCLRVNPNTPPIQTAPPPPLCLHQYL